MMKLSLIIVALFYVIGLSSAADKPNILVFMVDDLRSDLGCYGDDVVESPNIDALAKQGMLFKNAYCQEAICAPSRISILTGMRPESVGIYDLFTPLRKVNKEIVTMPQFLKDNGYTTVSVGKVYHHGHDDKESFSIHIQKEPNSYAKPENIAMNNKKGSKGPAFECIDVNDEAYKDGRAANAAIETLHKIKDESFAMFVGFTKPHLPFNAPKKYWDLYDRDQFVVPSKETPKNMNSLALTKWNELRAYNGIPKEGLLTDDLSKELAHGYHACISYTDAQIGKVMQTLEELNLRENTIVIVMSDHGWKLGEYGAWCKHTNFEIDVNAPLIITLPASNKKTLRNSQTNALVEYVDIFPTLAEACGLSTHQLDGKSLLPLLKNTNKKWSKAAYSLYPRGEKYMGVTCTDGEWRYTEWRMSDTQELIGKELYHHKNSVIATQNYAGNPEFSKQEKSMKLLLEKQFPSDGRSFYPDKN